MLDSILSTGILKLVFLDKLNIAYMISYETLKCVVVISDNVDYGFSSAADFIKYLIGVLCKMSPAKIISSK